jgi:hypothetical protein
MPRLYHAQVYHPAHGLNPSSRFWPRWGEGWECLYCGVGDDVRAHLSMPDLATGGGSATHPSYQGL